MIQERERKHVIIARRDRYQSFVWYEVTTYDSLDEARADARVIPFGFAYKIVLLDDLIEKGLPTSHDGSWSV